MNNMNNLILIKSALGFLEKEHHFSLREDPPQYYYFESSNCEILITFELSKVYVDIGPIGNAKSKLLNSGIRAGRADVKIVSQCLDPKREFTDLPWDAKINIEEELTLYAKLIKQYCQKMIAGDFSEWQIIQNCLKARREKLRNT